MVFMRNIGDDMMMWQNTSYDGLALCEIPLRKEQSERFIAAYRFAERSRPPPLIQVRRIFGMKTAPRERVERFLFPDLAFIMRDSNPAFDKVESLVL